MNEYINKKFEFNLNTNYIFENNNKNIYFDYELILSNEIIIRISTPKDIFFFLEIIINESNFKELIQKFNFECNFKNFSLNLLKIFQDCSNNIFITLEKTKNSNFILSFFEDIKFQNINLFYFEISEINNINYLKEKNNNLIFKNKNLNNKLEKFDFLMKKKNPQLYQKILLSFKK